MQHFNTQDAVWDYFQNEAPDKFLGSVPRLKFLLKDLRPGQKILNIGVGSGLFEEMAVKAGLDLWAMDPVAKSIENLKTRLNLGDKARVGYGEQMPFEDNAFDVIIASEVLEHLTESSTRATLSEIRRTLKPGGIFKGTVPARENLSDQLVVCPDCHKRFHRWGHEQAFTVEKMEALLREFFVQTNAREKLFVPFARLNTMGKLEGMLRLAMFWMGRNGSGQNVYFEARKQA